MSTPTTFKRRGKSYIGPSARVVLALGEIIIVAPDMRTLETAFKYMTGYAVDKSMVQIAALIDAGRVAKDGAVRNAKPRAAIVPGDEPKGEEGSGG
jgi:hypothetical protein